MLEKQLLALSKLIKETGKGVSEEAFKVVVDNLKVSGTPHTTHRTAHKRTVGACSVGVMLSNAAQPASHATWRV